MSSAKEIIERFGGQTALAEMIGKGQSTVAYWAKTGVIPSKWQAQLLSLAQERNIPLRAEDFIASKVYSPITRIGINNNALTVAQAGNPITPTQGELDLQIEKQIEIDGIGMGVLTDGTPFLTGRGLARLCGINNARIVEMGQDWDKQPSPPLVNGVKKILFDRGIETEHPFIEIKQRTGIFNAYPDAICLSVLEYYAFDAPNRTEQAQKNFRLLAGKALQEFIYLQVGYTPSASPVPDAWRQFHDRVSLTYNSLPQGYFGIFKEMSDMIVTLGQAGLHIDANFVPDISVGISWASHWKKNNFDDVYGERQKFEHNYPSYFPQAQSNPQEPWCYPEQALGEFRKWMREKYIGEGKFKNYIEGKVRDRQLPVSFAQLAISAYTEN